MNIFSGVEHISVNTKDMDKAISFYTDILGFRLLRREEIGEHKLRIAIIDLAGVPLELIQKYGENEEIPEGDGIVELISFRVSDMNGAISYLKTHGAEFLMDEPIQMVTGGCYIKLRGPSGEKLELIYRNN